MPESEKPTYPDILADRYASPEMVGIWTPENKVVLERDLWVAVLRGQAHLGLDVDLDAIKDYEEASHEVSLDSIREREARTKHDVKARIEEFNDLAGHELIHVGMTSRDLTENIEQMQIRDSLLIIRDKSVASLARVASLAIQHAELTMVGRSHNVPAQPTTLGKKFANFGQEMLHGHNRLQDLVDNYSLRGIKGPVGTQQDMLDIFEGDKEKVAELEQIVARHLGFTATLDSVGQVYPRSLDGEVVDALFGLSSGPANIAKNIRLMAGHDLVTEGFQEGQTFSSAMPHKMNARSSERIGGFNTILAGYQAMAAKLNGDQWNEGDVSCSVVRRVMLPGAFFASDGLQETHINVLDGFGAYPAVIEAETQKYLSFVSTTKILMTAVAKGAGRESAHKAIKEHAVALALKMREGGRGEPLFVSLGSDQRIPLNEQEIMKITSNTAELTGLAGEQVSAFAREVDALCLEHLEAANYNPDDIL